MCTPRPPPELTATVVALDSIARADIPDLCERVRALLEDNEAGLVVCDAGGVVDPDCVTVDALARLQLTARRLGRGVLIRNACGELQELLVFVGLDDVLPPGSALRLEPGGQPEEREQARGIEKEADPGDPTL